MATRSRIDLPLHKIAAICRAYQVRELSVFGSALRPDFRPDSDVDLLVEFEPGARVGLFRFGALQEELQAAVGRNVDLVPKRGLKPLIRDDVLASAEVLYAA
jgi:predicted nucleotidyltransferase